LKITTPNLVEKKYAREFDIDPLAIRLMEQPII